MELTTLGYSCILGLLNEPGVILRQLIPQSSLLFKDSAASGTVKAWALRERHFLHRRKAPLILSGPEPLHTACGLWWQEKVCVILICKFGKSTVFNYPEEGFRQASSHSLKAGVQLPTTSKSCRSYGHKAEGCSQLVADAAVLSLEAETTNSLKAQQDTTSLNFAPSVLLWMPSEHLKQYLFRLKWKDGLLTPLLHPAVGCSGKPWLNAARGTTMLSKGFWVQGKWHRARHLQKYR